MKKSLLLLNVFFLINIAKSQSFIDIKAPLTPTFNSAVNWADFDLDGDLDALVTGENYNGKTKNIVTRIYENKRNDHFVSLKINLMPVTRGASDWGDYDNDGDMDLLLTGETTGGKVYAKIYANHRSGRFYDTKIPLEGIADGSALWVDINNDGWLDIILSGLNVKGIPTIKVYRNEGKNCFTEVYTTLLPVFYGKIAVADYDRDGDMDLLCCGKTNKNAVISKVFRNDGTFRFTDINANLTPVFQAACDWGDYDRDGNPDIALCGQTASRTLVTKVYKNTGNNKFTDTKSVLPPVRSGSICWGDCDMDGDADLLITGDAGNNNIISAVYINNGNKGFYISKSKLHGVYLSDARWGNYDNDTDLDILLAGLDKYYNPVTKIYKNQIRSKPASGCRPEVKAPVTKIVTPQNFWISNYEVPEKKKPAWFVVWATCYCFPDSVFKFDTTYNNKLNAFVSNVFFVKPDSYSLHETYNGMILIDLKNWSAIDQGYRSVGFTTEKEANKLRDFLINDYLENGFTLHDIVFTAKDIEKIKWYPGSIVKLEEDRANWDIPWSNEYMNKEIDKISLPTQ
ncbi:MAG: VCBS repeat-containing protein [Lentimicrobiaceae bacterium]|nr:VCBS repeat-containing protein [Lentimicrobiaceae bacterium]